MEIEVIRGDITREQVDAIVNAANSSLLGGGGVDGAIHRAAGPELREAGAQIAPCPAGEAKVTPAFRLQPRIQWIIHTVGPVWHGGTKGEAEVLASCYRSALARADDLGVETMSIPAISTGVYGYPIEAAADIAMRTLRSTPTSVRLARLIAFDEANYSALAARLLPVAGLDATSDVTKDRGSRP